MIFLLKRPSLVNFETSCGSKTKRSNYFEVNILEIQIRR